MDRILSFIYISVTKFQSEPHTNLHQHDNKIIIAYTRLTRAGLIYIDGLTSGLGLRKEECRLVDDAVQEDDDDEYVGDDSGEQSVGSTARCFD
ncbi:unnamed protein product [Gongylonema pulchrum]|uniref:Rad21_Rec8 domain-containing protein n=1 Tax=Gongylonema pulchrum TaxID=637853 RepID=A0A183CXE2_9BILA|nr:unnamed protein product [Gongylonema pulchrum]